MENSHIEWCDHTFNPWIGCTKVSAGCANCYAETLDKNRFSKTLGQGTKEIPVTHWGKGAPRHKTSDAMWKEPLKWNRQASGAERRPRVFCASLADVFDAEVDQDLRDQLWELIAETPNLDWLLLTKRPENIGDMIPWADGQAHNSWKADVSMWPNVWLGTSVENQEQADKRIPDLLKVPAKVRFLSCEPLLGIVDLGSWLIEESSSAFKMLSRFYGEQGFDETGSQAVSEWMPKKNSGIHWVIVGGESGPSARPMDEDWALALRNQCVLTSTAFLFKQWGGTNKKAAGRILDGRTWDEFPTPA